MPYKIYNTTCPLIKKPVSIRANFEEISVCGRNDVFTTWMEYACDLQMEGYCTPSQQCDENFECPVYAQIIRQNP